MRKEVILSFEEDETGWYNMKKEGDLIRCKECKNWKRQTNDQGISLSFGFCDDIMWRSLYGEAYEIAHINTNGNHYCGYAERRTDEQTD